MDEKELMEIEGILVEERLRESLRQREQFMIFVPRCECGAYVDLGAPGVAVDGDLERVPPVLLDRRQKKEGGLYILRPLN